MRVIVVHTNNDKFLPFDLHGSVTLLSCGMNTLMSVRVRFTYLYNGQKCSNYMKRKGQINRKMESSNEVYIPIKVNAGKCKEAKNILNWSWGWFEVWVKALF